MLWGVQCPCDRWELLLHLPMSPQESDLSFPRMVGWPFGGECDKHLQMALRCALGHPPHLRYAYRNAVMLGLVTIPR